MICSRLPARPARAVLVSGEYPELAARVKGLGLDAITTRADVRLPKPVRWHPDMQVCIMDGGTFVLKGSGLASKLAEYEIAAEETDSIPGGAYPEDVLCNVLSWEHWALGNPGTVDRKIIQQAKAGGLEWITVKQGYAACATALVNDRAAITADNGVAKALEERGIEVLRIRPGFIELPGYGYGFIGGCCGKLAQDMMAFAGRLNSHPDGARITGFLATHNIGYVELMEHPLLDVGGMIALL